MPKSTERRFATAIWGREDRISMEICRFSNTSSGYRLEGTVLYRGRGGPSQASYQVVADAKWVTRSMHLSVSDINGESEMELTSDGQGRWKRDGEAMELPFPCFDVDIAITPATNTLAIRRLDLQVGQAQDAAVVWVQVPSFIAKPVLQTYTRVTKNTYKFGGRYGTYRIDVDENAVVLDYPGGGWRALAHRSK